MEYIGNCFTLRSLTTESEKGFLLNRNIIVILLGRAHFQISIYISFWVLINECALHVFSASTEN